MRTVHTVLLIALLAAVSVTVAQEWSLPLTVYKDTTISEILIAKTDSLGTDEYDQAVGTDTLDILHPPPPPSGFYAYFVIVDPYLSDTLRISPWLTTDVRSDTADTIIWEIRWGGATGASDTVTIEWDPQNVPVHGTLLIDTASYIDTTVDWAMANDMRSTSYIKGYGPWGFAKMRFAIGAPEDTVAPYFTNWVPADGDTIPDTTSEFCVDILDLLSPIDTTSITLNIAGIDVPSTYFGFTAITKGKKLCVSTSGLITLPTCTTLTAIVCAADTAGNSACDTISFTVECPPTYEISGTVTLEGESNYSGTVVTETGSGASDVTDSTGAYTLSDIPPGAVEVTVVHSGFYPDTASFTLSGDTSGVDFDLLAITVSYCVSGTVSLGGVPSADIVVLMDGLTDTTDVDGYYEICAAPSTYTINISHDGYYPVQRNLSLVADTVMNFDLVPMPTSGDISGTVTLDGETNYSGTIVIELGSMISDTTDSAGAYTLADVPFGAVQVTAAHTGFIPDTTSFTLSADTTGVDFLLLPILYTVDGIITLQESTNHSGTQIVLSNGTTYDDTVVTDSTGSFAFDDVPAGSFTFTATHDGFDIFDTTLSVSSDITINRQLFTGIAEGKPSLPGVMTLYGNIPNPFNATTDIVFELYRPDNIELTIFDIMGREVTTLVSGPMDRGLHRISWDGSDATGRTMGSGVYLCRMTTAKGRITDRMILIK